MPSRYPRTWHENCVAAVLILLVQSHVVVANDFAMCESAVRQLEASKQDAQQKGNLFPIHPTSSLAFLHIAKSGGSSFSLAISRSVRDILRCQIVPELDYPENKKAVGKVANLSLGRSICVTGQRSGVFESSEAMTTTGFIHKYGKDVSIISMARKPLDRIRSMFIHDYNHGPKRVNCAKSLESYLRLCCLKRKCTCQAASSLCKKYTNFASMRTEGVKGLQMTRFVGVTHLLELSYCVFLWKFQLVDRFQMECVKTHFKPSTLLLNTKEHTRKSAKKFRPPEILCNNTCRHFLTHDEALYELTMKRFWDDVARMLRPNGLGCREVVNN